MRYSFGAKVLELEREVHALKDTYIKTASGLATKTETMQAKQFPLTLGYGEAYCNQALKVTITTTDNTNQICMLTLEPKGSAVSYNMANRTVNIWQTTSVGKVTEYIVAVASLNATDIQKLMNGESVVLEYQFTVTGSSDFTITSEFINL